MIFQHTTVFFGILLWICSDNEECMGTWGQKCNDNQQLTLHASRWTVDVCLCVCVHVCVSESVSEQPSNNSYPNSFTPSKQIQQNFIRYL